MKEANWQANWTHVKCLDDITVSAFLKSVHLGGAVSGGVVSCRSFSTGAFNTFRS